MNTHPERVVCGLSSSDRTVRFAFRTCAVTSRLSFKLLLQSLGKEISVQVSKLFVTGCEELYFVHDSVHSNCSFDCSICPSAQPDSAIFRTTQRHVSHGCTKIFCSRTKCVFSHGQRSHQTLIKQNIFEMSWINEFRHRPYPTTCVQDLEVLLLE